MRIKLARMQFILMSCILFLFSEVVYACPMCAGSESSRDKYTVWILGVFVLLTYIPYTIIYRLTQKHKTEKKVKYNK